VDFRTGWENLKIARVNMFLRRRRGKDKLGMVCFNLRKENINFTKMKKEKKVNSRGKTGISRLTTKNNHACI
jgi:hypothetical protein